MTKDEVRRVIAYTRVSTTEQGVSGLGLADQEQRIREECTKRGWKLVAVCTDVTSGKSINGRHELKRALAELADRHADGLIVTKVDRLARSMLDFATITKQAADQGWALVLLEGGIDMSTPHGKAMAGMLSVFAELERELIGERTRNAMAVAKVRGPKPAVVKDGQIIEPAKKPIGRPRLIASAVEMRIVRRRRAGRSFQAIADELTAAGIATPTGGKTWSWTTAARIVRRHVNEPIRRRARSGRRT